MRSYPLLSVFGMVLLAATALPSSAKSHARWEDFFGRMRSATIPLDARKLIRDAQICYYYAGEAATDDRRCGDQSDDRRPLHWPWCAPGSYVEEIFQKQGGRGRYLRRVKRL
jgi:hypothetical protein